MPIEGSHMRAPVLFGGLQIWRRIGGEATGSQKLAFKSLDSNRVFVSKRKLFLSYDPPDYWDVVETPLSKTQAC